MGLRQFIMEQGLKSIRKRMYFDPDYSVETYLNKIPEFFDPDKAGNRHLVVVYEFHDSGDNNGAWTVTVGDGKCVLSKGDTTACDTRLYTTAEAYHRMLTGQLEFGRVAYSVGAVRFFGNTLGHRELNSYLSIPKKANLACL